MQEQKPKNKLKILFILKRNLFLRTRLYFKRLKKCFHKKIVTVRLNSLNWMFLFAFVTYIENFKAAYLNLTTYVWFKKNFYMVL